MRAICVGNSHMGALIQAALSDPLPGDMPPMTLAFVLLHREAFQPATQSLKGLPHLTSALHKALVAAETAVENAADFSIIALRQCLLPSPAATISLIGGNAHNVMGLLSHDKPFDFVLSEEPDLPLIEGAALVPEAEVYNYLSKAVEAELGALFRAIANDLDRPFFHLESPPPIRSDDHIREYLDPFFGEKATKVINPAALRYKLWRIHSRIMRDTCQRVGAIFVPRPDQSVDADGFLLPDLVPNNATHANERYGVLLIQQIGKVLSGQYGTLNVRYKSPYTRLGARAFWRESVAEIPLEEVNPVGDFPFKIQQHDRVATAGSCFAQHIARHLQATGFNYYVAETAHPLLAPSLRNEYNYGLYSARYGNIYTSRQLLQLFQRAEGRFSPLDEAWVSTDGSGFLDPFRPTVQPAPFLTSRDLDESRRHHLACVREMMRNLDVFIFTLGLTECWINKIDGAAYPLCPGTSGGTFDPQKHEFVNLSVSDVKTDLIQAIEILRSVNPNARVVLTVSPVPLKATASRDHVLAATTYSKSVLRAAAGEISNILPNVAYFPSYEIITGSYSRGTYFLPNLRDVSAEGVAHVMRVFETHMTHRKIEAGSAVPTPSEPQAVAVAKKGEAELICDEEMLESERLLELDRASGLG